MKNKVEIIIAYIILFIDKLKKWFIKNYPIFSAIFTLIFAIGVAGSVDRQHPINLTEIIVIAWLITGLGVLWFVLSYKEKIKLERRNKMKHKRVYNSSVNK